MKVFQFVLRMVLPALGLAFLASLAKAEDARVLPAGRSRFGVIYVQTSGITQQYDDHSQPQDITAPYNVELSAANLKAASNQLSSLVSTLNTYTNYRYDPNNPQKVVSSKDAAPNSMLLGDALDRGFLNVGAEAYRQQYNFAYQYGVTDRLTIGFMAPMIKTQVYTAHSISGDNSAADIYKWVQSSNIKYTGAVQNGLNVVSSANDSTLQGLLASRGYDAFSNYDGSGIGDLVFGGRYNYVDAKTKSGEYISSFQAGFTVPTGRVHLPAELTTPSYGQGCWDLGIANIFNYNPSHFITLSNGLHYTQRFADTRTLRVESDPSDFIPGPEDEQTVNELQGDKWWTSLGATFHLTRAIDLDTSYEWYWKSIDQYSGSRPIDYSYLSDNTNEYKETVHAGLSMNTIPAFMKKDFPIPAGIAFDVYIPTTGKNTLIAPYATAELDLYF